MKKVCYKVSLCENYQRQCCKAFIGLTNRAKIVGGGDPLYLKFWIKVTALERNRRFFDLFSLVAHRHLFRRFSLYVPLVICNSTMCLAYLMLLLSFVLCIMRPIVSCQAACATGLLPYAIVNSLAVSTDHWFPLKTAVAQYPRQASKQPKKPQPATAKIARPMSLKKTPNWSGKPRNWQHCTITFSLHVFIVSSDREF